MNEELIIKELTEKIENSKSLISFNDLVFSIFSVNSFIINSSFIIIFSLSFYLYLYLKKYNSLVKMLLNLKIY